MVVVVVEETEVVVAIAVSKKRGFGGINGGGILLWKPSPFFLELLLLQERWDTVRLRNLVSNND